MATKPGVVKSLAYSAVSNKTYSRGKHPNSKLAYERNGVLGQLALARSVVGQCNQRFCYCSVPVFHRQHAVRIESLKNRVVADLRELEKELFMAYDHKMGYVHMIQPAKSRRKAK